MKKIILKEAFEELNDTIVYYEEQQDGLGLRLKDEVDRHVNWILGNSSIPRIRRGGYRRVNLKIFPYYIAYIRHLSKINTVFSKYLEAREDKNFAVVSY
ncbi:MAG: type II toxin-antitoxin system RelE/ParE family toxin [bacterium]